MPGLRIDVEREMREVVRITGGTVLDEHLAQPPDFENADFVFHSEKLVVELKCLTEDHLFSETIEEKIGNIWRRCYVKGLVANPTRNDPDFQRLPKSVQNQIYEIRTRTIKKRIQKANRQIRQTKERLGLGDYQGVLLIANDGITSISPPAFIHATQLALRSDFKEVRHFVFLTANLLTRMRANPLPVLFWISFDMQDGGPVDHQFLNRLGDAWRAHCCRITGIPSVEEELEDIEGFWKSTYVGRSGKP